METLIELLLELIISTLEGGTIFHVADISLDDALNEDAIYMTVSGGKDNRVQISNLKDGFLLQRDGCHNVCRVNMSIVLNLD